MSQKSNDHSEFSFYPSRILVYNLKKTTIEIVDLGVLLRKISQDD